VEEVTRFYSNFHSYRYVGDKLVVRLQRKLTDKHMRRIRSGFADILKSGDFTQSGPLKAEEDEPMLDSLPRLVFRHRRRNFGRLREFIDEINS
ncbi:MAG: cytochrome D ubiquinol oxidase subunit II, partial [Verrucomicrobiae bacterium]|nr:cytochrome D ubiquinol oxidase subunit II [Verrucomicrobiae bacterium]NNJ85995.1 cytochrome D ubiquinol oxidase subunit II [Akkermansiaceae bacterium]